MGAKIIAPPYKEWYDLVGKQTLDGLTTKTVTLDLSLYKRLRVVGTYDNNVGAVDNPMNILMSFNGASFNGLYKMSTNYIIDNSTVSGILTSSQNQWNIGYGSQDIAAANYVCIIEAIVYSNPNDLGRYYMLSEGFLQYQTVSPMSRRFMQAGVLETTSSLSSMTIFNGSSVTFGDKSHFYLYGSKAA